MWEYRDVGSGVADGFPASCSAGISVHAVENEEETLNWLFHGEVNRTTAEHLLNKESNRSHCIFTIYLTQRARLGSSAAKVGGDP